jgi:hypothetical protein
MYSVAYLSSFQVWTVSDDPIRATGRFQGARPLKHRAPILALFFWKHRDQVVQCAALRYKDTGWKLD